MSEKSVKELREERDTAWAAYLEAIKMAPEAAAQAWQDFVDARHALMTAGMALHRASPALSELHENWMMAEERAMESGSQNEIKIADQARTAYYEAKAAAEAAHAQ